MKYHAHTIDARIHKFMEKKIHQFPELGDQNTNGSFVSNRGHVWDDIVGLFNREGA